MANEQGNKALTICMSVPLPIANAENFRECRAQGFTAVSLGLSVLDIEGIEVACREAAGQKLTVLSAIASEKIAEALTHADEEISVEFLQRLNLALQKLSEYHCASLVIPAPRSAEKSEMIKLRESIAWLASKAADLNMHIAVSPGGSESYVPAVFLCEGVFGAGLAADFGVEAGFSPEFIVDSHIPVVIARMPASSANKQVKEALSALSQCGYSGAVDFYASL